MYTFETINGSIISPVAAHIITKEVKVAVKFKNLKEKNHFKIKFLKKLYESCRCKTQPNYNW